MNNVFPIRPIQHQWARYCIDRGLSFREYVAGFARITGENGEQVLRDGFAVLARAVRQSVDAPYWNGL